MKAYYFFKENKNILYLPLVFGVYFKTSNGEIDKDRKYWRNVGRLRYLDKMVKDGEVSIGHFRKKGWSYRDCKVPDALVKEFLSSAQKGDYEFADGIINEISYLVYLGGDEIEKSPTKNKKRKYRRKKRKGLEFPPNDDFDEEEGLD